ncbi:MAG TPA: D-tyrosyl-tRNA(Tyr) deacylase, partial [Treponema sp.]|nr:D-tyrosyl-tRNA(Tyr) deacylase [Treponema sp.]
HLRIFHDDDGKMNRSLMDINNALRDTDGAKGADGGKQEQAGVLAVSQFTLLGDARKGRRPSWGKAAAPDEAKRLYEYFIRKIREQGLVCETGEFQAHMQVSYTNDGPVTILLDSRD